MHAIADRFPRRIEYLVWAEFPPSAERTSWLVCGHARERHDGSLKVRLDLLPPGGVLHLRPVHSSPPSSVPPPTLAAACAPRPFHHA